MALIITVDKVDELPESLRSAAKEANGKFVVTELPKDVVIENVAGLKSAFENEKTRRREAVEAAQPFLDAGLTPKEAKEAAEALLKMRAGSLKSVAEIDAWKSEVSKKHQEELAKNQDMLGTLSQQARELLVRGQLASIIAAKGGSESMDAIIALAERNIRVDVGENKKLVPVVVGNDGKTPLVTKKVGSMDPMGFEELIDGMRESPATKGLFRATATGGSGSPSQNGAAGRVANPGQPMSAREMLDRANAAP
jgi:hypothetical protein